MVAKLTEPCSYYNVNITAVCSRVMFGNSDYGTKSRIFLLCAALVLLIVLQTSFTNITPAYADGTQTVPLHRFYISPGTDHFYTANKDEYNQLIKPENSWWITYEFVVACVFPQGHRFEGTEAWHGYLQDHGNWADYDHFYTTWQDGEKDTSSDIGDYKWFGVAAYIYSPNGPVPKDTVPLHRWYSASAVDHVYAIPGLVKDAWDNEPSLKYEGIEGYVYEYDGSCPFIENPSVHLDDATTTTDGPVHPGDTITASFTVTNDHLFDVNVGLGMSIRKTGGGPEIGDADLGPEHERVVSISQQGRGAVFTRPFTIPESIEPGKYDVALAIWDGIPGRSNQIECKCWLEGQLIVEPLNHPPIARAGEDIQVSEGDLVTLDASGSTDQDGDTLSYSWVQEGSPAVSISGNNVAKVTFTAPSVDSTTTLKFKVVVSDGIASSEDTISIAVKDVPDTQKPLIEVPAQPIERQAAGPTGAVVTYTVTVTDNIDTNLVADCTPRSGSTFPVGETIVKCNVKDKAGNAADEKTFKIIVTAQPPIDNTKPSIEVPTEPVTKTASSPEGATVTYTVTVTDNIDTNLVADCTPRSGSTFPIGETTVRCNAEDAAGNKAEEKTFSISVTLTDMTPPDITIPSTPVTATAPDSAGASVTYAVLALDDVGGSVPVNCVPPSGSIFAVATTKVTCTATDGAGNEATASFDVIVTASAQNIPPDLTVPPRLEAQASDSSGIAVDFGGQVSASDTEDGAITPNCTPASGTTFSVGNTTVTCTATDSDGAVTTKVFPVMVTKSATTGTGPTVPGPTGGGFTIESAMMPIVAAVAVGGAIAAILIAKRRKKEQIP
jgi:hypothetical protein